MTGFSSLIPFHLFDGSRIDLIEVGSSSLKFILNEKREILLLYYGAIEDKDDWLYGLPLCGEESIQELVGESIDEICVKSINQAEISFSNGRVLRISHDDPKQELVRFSIDGDQYFA